LNEDDGDDGQGDAEPTADANSLFPQEHASHGRQANFTRGNHWLDHESGQGREREHEDEVVARELRGHYTQKRVARLRKRGTNV
jgi:hypothetical protein